MMGETQAGLGTATIATREQPTATLEWSSGGAIETPTWFGPDGRKLFGWLARPAAGPMRTAVVLCAPFGEEARSARRTLRELSRRLAKSGALVLRFDYHGTGDSAGDLEMTAGAHSWVASVHEAVEYLRQCGAPSVSIIGMRIGATIAATAAAAHMGCADRLILWDPCTSGRQFLREQAMLHRSAQERDGTPLDVRNDDATEVSSYLLRGDVVAALSALKLDVALKIDTDQTRVSVLVRDDRAPAPVVGRLWEQGVRVVEVPGQAELLDVTPVIAATPTQTIGVIESILAEDKTVFAPADPLPLNQQADMGGGVTEKVVCVGDGLFGIVSEPSQVTASTAVFFNVSSECHIGPARLWVTLARQWADVQGRPSLRFDFTGVGDSPDALGGEQDQVYPSRWIDDADSVIAQVQRQTPRVVTVGLCAGAYAAMEVASRLCNVDVIAINPLTDRIELTRTLTSPGSWDSRRRGYRRVPKTIVRLWDWHGKIGWPLWRAIQQIWPPAAALAVVGNIRRRGGRVLLVAGEYEGSSFAVNPYWMMRAWFWRRRALYSRVIADDLEHSLKIASGRERFVRAATEFVSRLPYEPERKPTRDGRVIELDGCIVDTGKGLAESVTAL